jgi:hypothetical protein
MPPKRGAAGTRCTTSAAHGATEFATGSRSVAGQSAAQFVVEAATQLAAQATTPTIALVLRYASKVKSLTCFTNIVPCSPANTQEHSYPLDPLCV